MNKIRIAASILLLFFVITSTASAHVSFGLRFYAPPVAIGPPVIPAPPPAYYTYPYGYYGHGYYGYRVWMPGYWSMVWSDHGWVRIWHRGHWDYRP